jgi:hypothetical protein
MNTEKTTFIQRNRIRLIMGFVVFSLIALGWQWYQRHFPSWDEEVQLSDGRMLIVHRAHKFNTEGALIETALTFDLPEMGGKQTWREFLYPAIVDVYEGKVYVVGDVRGSLQKFSAYRDPRFLYVAFVYESGQWTRIPFSKVPQHVRTRENIPGCLKDASRNTWDAKQIGWCGDGGSWKPDEQRAISLEVRESLAKNMLRMVDGTAGAKFGSE